MELNNDLKPRSSFPKIFLVHKYNDCWNGVKKPNSWINIEYFDRLLNGFGGDDDLKNKLKVINILMLPCPICRDGNNK